MMAKAAQTEEVAAAPAQIAEPSEFPLTLEEFCSRISTTDKRVELIGAFAHEETRAGRIKGLASEYEARFRAFVTKPA
jgi:hypothetical protein